MKALTQTNNVKNCAKTFRVLNDGDCFQEIEIQVLEDNTIMLDLDRGNEDAGSLILKNVGDMKHVLFNVLKFLEEVK